MLNQKSIKQVSNYRLDSNFFKPHPNYNIKYLLNSIRSSFGIENSSTLPFDCFKEDKECNHMIFILLDGLGYSLLEKCLSTMPENIKEFFEEEFLISKISTMYPSATTCVIPFLMTGYLPEESGIYEWWQYEHNTEKMICPFLYKYRNGDENEEMDDLDVEAESIFVESKFYKELTDNDIDVFVYTSYTSPFNNVSNKYANVVKSQRLSVQRSLALQSIRDSKSKKTLQYIYDPEIDAVEHKRGNDSEEIVAVVQNRLFEIYQLIKDIKKNSMDDVQVVITADHGLINCEDEILLDCVMPNLKEYLKTNGNGEHITFGGSPRACVLHIKDDMLDDFVIDVKEYIKGYGDVFKLEDLKNLEILNNGFECSESFKKNMGNVVLMAYEDKGIWFDQKDRKILKSQHGGLSDSELHIPLMVY